MNGLIGSLITKPIIYSLLFFYWLIVHIPGLKHADLGLAVILFTLCLRIILLPLTLLTRLSHSDRLKLETQTPSSSPPPPAGTTIASIKIVIIVISGLVIWRFFARLSLFTASLPPFFASIPTFNSLFLGQFELSKPHFSLALLATALIFLHQAIKLIFSPTPPNRQEIARLQLLLPLLSLLVLSRLTSGLSLFIIANVSFNLLVSLVDQAQYYNYKFTQSSPPSDT